jgi:hypothetical protein
MDASESILLLFAVRAKNLAWGARAGFKDNEFEYKGLNEGQNKDSGVKNEGRPGRASGDARVQSRDNKNEEIKGARLPINN